MYSVPSPELDLLHLMPFDPTNYCSSIVPNCLLVAGVGQAVISGLGRSRQENSYNCKVSLGYLEVTSEVQAAGLGM